MAKVLLENGKGKEVEELLAQESDPHTKDEILAAIVMDDARRKDIGAAISHLSAISNPQSGAVWLSAAARNLSSTGMVKDAIKLADRLTGPQRAKVLMEIAGTMH
jgi:hypothetical protein